MKKIFSGVRPTGDIHIGNYLGAIDQWVNMQEKNDCIFSIADWHAITTPYNEETIQDTILEIASIYLASGIDPEKCILFVQSRIKQHVELAWLLGSITPLGELQRMTQFKDKSKKNKEYINAGLLNYPILMASDILLYDANMVPVGKDQVQHVELTRNIAQKFNNKYGKTFDLPEAILSEAGATIYSLQEPDKKMSKTGNPKGCIGLFDDPKEIEKKIMSAQTDSSNEIRFDKVKKPGISNLLNIYSLFSKKSIKEIEKDFQSKGYGEFKSSLADLLIEKLIIIQENIIDKKEVEKILDLGAKKAEAIAERKMKIVRKKMGLSL